MKTDTKSSPPSGGGSENNRILGYGHGGQYETYLPTRNGEVELSLAAEFLIQLIC